MLVGIHQPHYLPWLRYFEKIARTDVFIVLDTVQYNKNGWQNRNRIKSSNGPLLLTVPVHASLGQTIETVGIRDTEPWRIKHLRSIEQAYRKAPYFGRYWDLFTETYACSWPLLNELNKFMLAGFVKALGIETRIVYASQLDVPGIATERLINLIKTVGGTRYYSGAYATDAYLDAESLRANGISLEIQHWESPTYLQLHGEFVPDLSIIDLLMNCGGRSLRTLLSVRR